MRVFDLFRKKKAERNEKQLKWNQMWDLWVQGRAQSPYAELMTYQSEVNNGGHGQYFENVGNNGDLSKEMSILETALSDELINNFKKAYQAYLTLEENADDNNAEEIMEQCDLAFYENEDEINRVLEAYAERLVL